MNSWATLGARKAEVTRPFRSGNHKASIEDSPLVSTSRQGWLLSGPILVGGGRMTFPPTLLGLAVMKQGANQSTDTPEKELDRKHDTKNWERQHTKGCPIGPYRWEKY